MSLHTGAKFSPKKTSLKTLSNCLVGTSQKTGDWTISNFKRNFKSLKIFPMKVLKYFKLNPVSKTSGKTHFKRQSLKTGKKSFKSPLDIFWVVYSNWRKKWAYAKQKWTWPRTTIKESSKRANSTIKRKDSTINWKKPIEREP